MLEFFAPIIKNNQEVFQTDSSTINSYTVKFLLPKSLNPSEIGNLQVRVISYSTNENLINYSQSSSPDGIFYQIYEKDKNSIVIDPTILKQKMWSFGALYKIQVRFGSSPSLWGGGVNFSDWRKNNKNSEWSNVAIIKPINKPILKISGADLEPIFENTLSVSGIEDTKTPIFSGSCHFSPNDKEYVDKFRFEVYSKNGQKKNLIESSGWMSRKEYQSKDFYQIQNPLSIGTQYSLRYDVLTKNGFRSDFQRDTSAIYDFEVRDDGSGDPDISLSANSKDKYCREEGCINIYFSPAQNGSFSGDYMIKRASEKDNYSSWEDLKRITLTEVQTSSNVLVYSDFTIESGVEYKYGAQKLTRNSDGTTLRSSIVYESSDLTHKVFFEYSYLYCQGKQLKLKYNNKINSFKKVLFANKFDTLGAKYPIILKNGNTNYAEFPISSLISFLSDENKTFTEHNTEIEHYHLSDENIQEEKNFREKVQLFLYDETPKLFKSPTEGNFIVSLMNISFTPNQTLNRLIYDFSATAYEVAENNLKNLHFYKIIGNQKGHSLGPDENIPEMREISTFGSVNTFISRDAASEEQDVIALIQKDLSSRYRDYNALQLNSLKFRAAEENSLNVVHFIVINSEYPKGKEFIFNTDKIFYLDEALEDLNIQSLLIKDKAPLHIDYTCSFLQMTTPISLLKMSRVSAEQKRMISTVIGQLNGIFSSPKKDYSLDILQSIKEKVGSNQVDFLYLSIESETGTTLVLTNKNGQNSTIVLGPTERYIINAQENSITGISFQEPCAALVDYRCKITT